MRAMQVACGANPTTPTLTNNTVRNNIDPIVANLLSGCSGSGSGANRWYSFQGNMQAVGWGEESLTNREG